MIVLLDFDDTLSEYSHFIRLYTESMANLLLQTFGGSLENWTRCTIKMVIAIEADYVARFIGNPLNGYKRWRRHANNLAADLLFDDAGVTAPPDVVRIVRALHNSAVAKSAAIFPGMAETVTALHQSGIPLCIASGNDSKHIRSAISPLEFGRFFKRLYGPDLVDCAKEGPEFYARIAQDQGQSPQEFLVVDNDPAALQWASDSGMSVLHVHLLATAPRARDMFDLPTITNTSDLTQLVLELAHVHN